MDKQKQPKLKVKASEEVLKGRHTNMMHVSHSKEGFVLDFFLAHPPVGQMLARLITTPGHAKKIAAAIAKNIEKYEKRFGKIEEVKEPETPIGFKV